MQTRFRRCTPAMIVTAVAATAIATTPARAQRSDASARETRFIDSVLARMSLEDKLGQLTQYRGRGTPTGPATLPGGEDEIRAGRVGSFLGIHGAETTRRLQRIAVEESPRHIPLLFAHDVIHGFRTIFPVPLAEAASWDPEAAERSARTAATEATAAGLHWTFAPMVDIARDPRWGRIVEGSGEDPFLGAVMAAARVRGFQGASLSNHTSLMATAKHFVAYGAAEGGRDYNVADVSPQTLWDVYLTPFHAAVDAGTASIMASFNEVAGTPMHANGALINGVLRRDWGWNGVLVSDYTGVMELMPHGVAADSASAAALAMHAGVDVDMVSAFYLKALPRLIRDGRVPMREIDDAVRRVLHAKYALGLFSNPYGRTDAAHERATLLSAENRAASRAVAQRSIVLLKNDAQNGAPVLPIAKSTRTIGVIGALAADARSSIGNWAADGRANEAVTVLDGIRRAVSPSTRVLYAAGSPVTGPDTSGFADARRIADSADVIVVVAGEREDMTAEASSRASIELPGVQEGLVQSIMRSGKPTAVVLMNGRPLAIPWIAEHVPAIVEAWFLGSEMGNAVADVLFGDVNPGGKLPVTMPRTTGQIPIYYSHKNTGRPPRESEKYTSKYLDVPWTPQFPFGFGLSYTSFAYTTVRLSRETMGVDDSLVVSVDVTNTGKRTGDDVVQLYLRDEVGSLTRPVKELRGFRRVSLAPSETRTVSFTLSAPDLAFFDRDTELVVEPGFFRVFVGTSSDNVSEARFRLVDERRCAKLVLPRSIARFSWTGHGFHSARPMPVACRAR